MCRHLLTCYILEKAVNPNLVTVVSAPLGPFDVVCLSLLGSRLANSTVVCISLNFYAMATCQAFRSLMRSLALIAVTEVDKYKEPCGQWKGRWESCADIICLFDTRVDPAHTPSPHCHPFHNWIWSLSGQGLCFVISPANIQSRQRIFVRSPTRDVCRNPEKRAFDRVLYLRGQFPPADTSFPAS